MLARQDSRFLPGKAEIFGCLHALSQLDSVRKWGEVHCIYAGQDANLEQASIAALSKTNKFVVILSTDVCGASLSLPLDAVMCSGLQVKRAQNGSLVVDRVCAAVRSQRRGRAGRFKDRGARFYDLSDGEQTSGQLVLTDDDAALAFLRSRCIRLQVDLPACTFAQLCESSSDQYA